MKKDKLLQKRMELIKQIENEFLLFKCSMLSKSNAEIFDSCNIIHFYHCIYEYFMYVEELKDEYLYKCLENDSVIAVLYELHLKYEYLKCDSWENIEELLNVWIKKNISL